MKLAKLASIVTETEWMCIVIVVSCSSVTEGAIPHAKVRLGDRLEILYGSRWIPVCRGANEIATTEVACRQMGFKYIVAVEGRQNHTESLDSDDELYLDFDCQGTEQFLVDCPTNGPSHIPCSTSGPVTCSNLSSGNPGDIVRLYPKKTEDTGLLQVNFMGEWWTICQDSLSHTTGQLACKQLGFKDVQSVSPKGISKNRSDIPTEKWFGMINCKGTESTLGECKHHLDETYSCSSGSLVELKCTNKESTILPDFQIRLVGGMFPSEGRVEISYGEQWGTICDDDWSFLDANVACRQLGFYSAETVASSAYYGQGSGPIFLDDVSCLGNESHIINCSHAGIGQHNCDHKEDAGVRCHENLTYFDISLEKEDTILPFIVILINGIIALVIVVGCLIYCSLKLWDHCTGHAQRARLHRSLRRGMAGENDQTTNIPMEYTEEPPPYYTVCENHNVYIAQRSETPPPAYTEAMKLQAQETVTV